MRKHPFIFCAVVVVLVMSACGKSDSDTKVSPTTKITTAQAQQLAQVLTRNYDAKNATFVATAGSFSTQGFVTQGKVDWTGNVVALDVSLHEANTVDISSVTTTDGVNENFIGLADAELEAKMEPRIWVFRPFAPTQYGIDALAQFVEKLGSPTPDNPVLIKQGGAQYLGTAKVGTVTTSKFSNAGLTYYISKNGLLIQIDAHIKALQTRYQWRLPTLGKRQSMSRQVPMLIPSTRFPDSILRHGQSSKSKKIHKNGPEMPHGTLWMCKYFVNHIPLEEIK